MAITIAATTTPYNGGFLASHTISGFDTSAADPYLLVPSFNKNPAVEVTETEGDTVDMTLIESNIFANVCSIQGWGQIPADASTDIVSKTPTFKEQTLLPLTMSGVNQSSPFNATAQKNNNFGTGGTVTHTWTEGSMLIIMGAAQADVTYTPTNCTELYDTQPATGIGGCFVGYVEATGESQTVGFSLPSSTNWRLMVLEFYAAEGGVTARRRAMIIS